MTTPVTVTVENGELVSVKRTNAAVNSETLKLVGSILVVATNKVIEFSGNVQLKDSQNVIGTFHYNNNDGTITDRKSTRLNSSHSTSSRMPSSA